MSNIETAEPTNIAALLLKRDLARRTTAAEEPSRNSSTGPVQASAQGGRFVVLVILAGGFAITIAWIGVLFWTLSGVIRYILNA